MQASGRSVGQTFIALQNPGFRLYFFVLLVGSFGSQMQGIANLWLIYSMTGSALQLGLTGLARAIPSMVFTLIGGVVADRMDRRMIILLSQVANGISAMVLAPLAWTGQIEVWHIYAVTLLAGSVGSLGGAAQRSVISNLVPREHLMNAMAMRFGLNQSSRIVAPSLAGVLIAVFGVPIAYLGNGIAHIITGALLLRIHMGPTPTRVASSPVRDLTDGFVYVREHSVLLAVLGVDSVTMFFGDRKSVV